MAEDEDQAVHPVFLKFCIANGIEFGPIVAGYVPNGWRGVLATAKIDPNTCILRVPQRILLSCESARRDDHLAAAIQSVQANLPSIALLAVHLLHEISKSEKSFWDVYLRSLPPSYSTAMCLTQKETASLQVPYAKEVVGEAQRAAEQRYAQAFPVLQALELPSKYSRRNAWLWAESTLSSRTMHLPFNNAGCLTPFGDLFNYAPPPHPITPHLGLYSTSTSTMEAENDDLVLAVADSNKSEVGGDGALDPITQQYCIYARKQYNPGDEVFLCYGRHTNLELLEHYGFVLENNPHDIAILPIDVFPEAVLVQLNNMGAAPVVHANGNPSWELLRALRMGSLTPGQRKSHAWEVMQDRKVDEESEKWVLKILTMACRATLEGLETTLEQDEGALKDAGFEEGMKMVVSWRMGYKKTLKKAMENCRRVQVELGGDGKNEASSSLEIPLANLVIRRPKLLGSKRASACCAPPAGDK